MHTRISSLLCHLFDGIVPLEVKPAPRHSTTTSRSTRPLPTQQDKLQEKHLEDRGPSSILDPQKLAAGSSSAFNDRPVKSHHRRRSSASQTLSEQRSGNSLSIKPLPLGEQSQLAPIPGMSSRTRLAVRPRSCACHGLGCWVPRDLRRAMPIAAQENDPITVWLTSVLLCALLQVRPR